MKKQAWIDFFTRQVDFQSHLIEGLTLSEDYFPQRLKSLSHELNQQAQTILRHLEYVDFTATQIKEVQELLNKYSEFYYLEKLIYRVALLMPDDSGSIFEVFPDDVFSPESQTSIPDQSTFFKRKPVSNHVSRDNTKYSLHKRVLLTSILKKLYQELLTLDNMNRLLNDALCKTHEVPDQIITNLTENLKSAGSNLKLQIMYYQEACEKLIKNNSLLEKQLDQEEEVLPDSPKLFKGSSF